jgi:hypothetical protein
MEKEVPVLCYLLNPLLERFLDMEKEVPVLATC